MPRHLVRLNTGMEIVITGDIDHTLITKSLNDHTVVFVNFGGHIIHKQSIMGIHPVAEEAAAE